MMFPWSDRAGRFSWLKALTLAACLLPGVAALYWYAQGAFGPLPIKAAMKFIGLWSLRFLLVTLALTPLQRLAGIGRLALVRRMLGVTAAVYAGLHFLLYIPYSGWSASKVFGELTLRVYLMVGFTALILLVMLAIISTDGWISRLGATWKRLHKLTYAVALLALLHMSLQEKFDATPALQLFGLFMLLMAFRFHIRQRWPARPTLLLVTTAVTAAATALSEAAWYATNSLVIAKRVLLANLHWSLELRPAQLVLIAGIALTLLAALSKSKRGSPAPIQPAYSRSSNSPVG